MSSTVDASGVVPGTVERRVSAKQVVPVKIWASFGVLFLAFQVYVVVKWVSGPYFEHVSSGPSEVPAGMRLGFWVVAVMTWLLAPVVAWRWVLKPRIRTGRFTTEGLMVIWCAVSAWFFDPISSMFTQVATWNSYAPNWGSWVADIPGWHSFGGGRPGAMMIEPVLYTIPSYLLVGACMFLLVLRVMQWAQRRFPNLGSLGLVAVGFIAALTENVLVEVFLLRLGIYGYRSTIPGLTFFEGHYYQFSIWEIVVAAFFYTSFPCLLFFRNDKGQTLPERGLERVVAGPKAKTMLRYFALAAGFSACYMFSFNIPYWILSPYATGEWNHDIQQRSYLTNHLCGPGTGKACTASSLPSPSRGLTAHFDFSGKLIEPPGVLQPGS